MASGVWWPRKIAPAWRNGGQDGLRIVERQLDMFGGDAIGQRRGGVEAVDGDDGAELLPALAGDGLLGQERELAIDLGGHGIGQARIGGDENGLGPCPVLGLGDEIGGDPGGIGGAIGDDEDFGGPGDHVDADLAEDLALGGGDEGIARPTTLSTRAMAGVP